MKPKKSLSFLAMVALVFACLLGIAGCGSSASSSESTSQSSTTPQSTAASETSSASESASGSETPTTSESASGSKASTAIENSSSASEETEPETADYTPLGDTIDFTLDEGNLRYNRVEKAKESLTDEKGALVFVFDFTNASDKATMSQSVFWIQFFQNGVELTDNASYSTNGGDQYKLVNAFFKSALKGGTVTFGRIVVPEDDSPITVLVKKNGGFSNDEYQTMEVAIDGSGKKSESESDEKSPNVTAESVDAALQGSWTLIDDNGSEVAITFDQGFINMEKSEGTLSGTYEVDVAKSAVICHMETTDAKLKVSLPFEYDGTTLKVFNNRGEELQKR